MYENSDQRPRKKTYVGGLGETAHRRKSVYPSVIYVYDLHCIIFDIEVEFDGKEACNIGAPMPCITLQCSCGYCAVIGSGYR